MAVIKTIHIPNETVNDDTVTVISLVVDNGAKVTSKELLAELETSKTTIEVISPCDGYVEFCCSSKDELQVGAEFALIHDKVPSLDDEEFGKGKAKLSATPNTQISDDAINRSPAFSGPAEKMLVRYGVDRNVFRGKGIVRAEDVAAHLGIEGDFPKSSGSKFSTTSHSVTSEPEVLPDYLSPIGITKELSRAKQLEIAILAAEQNQLASNVSIKIRVPKEMIDNGHPAIFGNLQNHLIPLLLTTTCALLKKHSALNAFYYEGKIHYYQETQLGYALDLGEGLTVVNLGDVSGETTKEVNHRIVGYVRQYMIHKIPSEALTGCTFTVTDLMAEGVTGFTPLINRFQSGILGVSAIDLWDRSMELTLSFDHRVTEGKQAAGFLKELKTSIESDLSPG